MPPGFKLLQSWQIVWGPPLKTSKGIRKEKQNDFLHVSAEGSPNPIKTLRYLRISLRIPLGWIVFGYPRYTQNVAIIPNTSLHNPVVIPLKFLHHLLCKIYRALSGIPMGFMLNTRISHAFLPESFVFLWLCFPCVRNRGSQVVTHVFDMHDFVIRQGFDGMFKPFRKNM